MPVVSRSTVRILSAVSLMIVAAGTFGGCVLAAVGAGAAGGVAYTDRGAKGDINHSLDDVTDHTKDAFKKMGIALTDTAMKHSGEEQDLVGKYGGMDVSVQITKSTPNLTHVEVIARESTLKWNKDYAGDVLKHIVAEG